MSRHIFLNLDKHDPDEFIGKVIAWKSQLFYVGRYLASGNEAIVHTLVDALNGKKEFVIKIMRNLEYKPNFDQAIDGEFFTPSPHILMTAYIKIPGGVAAIQPNVWAGRNPNLLKRLREADSYYQANNLNEASILYEGIIKDYPNNPRAIYNFAVTLAGMGELHKAYLYFLQTINLDPYDITFHHATLQCAFACSYFYICKQLISSVFALFPKAAMVGEVAIQVYIECGEPERAENILDSVSDIEPKQVDKLRRLIKEDIEAKHSALGFLKKQKDITSKSRPDLVTLSKAYHTYKKSPEIKMNLAFALRNDKKAFSKASQLLVSVANTFDPVVGGICLINAGFCSILNGDIEEAFRFLEIGYKYMNPSDSKLHHLDMTGLVDYISFVGEENQINISIIKPASETLKVMNLATERLSHNDIPENITKMIHLWELSVQDDLH